MMKNGYFWFLGLDELKGFGRASTSGSTQLGVPSFQSFTATMAAAAEQMHANMQLQISCAYLMKLHGELIFKGAWVWDDHLLIRYEASCRAKDGDCPCG
eukprot:1157559-Pelagomonas_calceolata.AAC.3